MVINLFLLIFLCDCTVKSLITSTTSYYSTQESTSATLATEAPEDLPSLQLVATPDHPVTEGQSIDLFCNSSTMLDNVIWSWQRLNNQIWEEVSSGRALTLTKAEQSGLYRCSAERWTSWKRVSHNYTVNINYIHATVGEKLGPAAFVMSLLALIICLAILCWLFWQRLNDSPTSSNGAAKGFPGPEKTPKGGLPNTASDGDVYINYINQNYADLDPTNMTEDNVYSSLS